MNRHNKPGAAGFSFVELLVTILIAAIAFAVMFPLFVGAQQQQTADGFRVMSLNRGQEMIERVHQLDYDQITTANLRDPDFSDHQFGLTANVASGGTTRIFHTVGTVTLKPDGATLGTEAYKLVTVEVWWDAPPKPVKRVVLQTYVYRQYSGPQIVNLVFSPAPTILGEDLVTTVSSLKLTATIADNDVSSMTVNAAKGWVTFAVAALNGSYSKSTDNTIKTPVSGIPSQYSWTWDATGAPDGKYVFSAKAVSALQRPGAVYERTVIVNRQAPPPVANFQITPQNGSLSLSWNASTEGDISHYQIWRGGASGAETLLVDDYTGTSYLDSGLTNGTTYYYYIKGVDIYDQVGSPCAEKSETPAVPVSDTTPPTAPSGLTATTVSHSGQIDLVWTASVDNPPPTTPTGVGVYVVERGTSATGPWTQLTTDCTTVNFTDTTAGFSSPLYYYRVMAFDIAGNPSAYSSVVSRQTDGPPTGGLRLVNKVGGKIYVKVKYNTTPAVYYNGTGGVVASSYNKSINNNGQSTWTPLPVGSYTVLWDSNSGGSYSSQKTVTVSAGTTLSNDLP